MLEAALAEFGERGYYAASIESIAERAGVTKGAVYYYFHDKGDLACDVEADLWVRLGREAARGHAPGASTAETLKVSFRAFLRGLQDLGEARFFLRDCWAVPNLDVAGRQAHESGVDLLRSVLDTGVTQGELVGVDTEAAARVLLGAFADATLHILRGGDIDRTVEVVDRLVDAFAVPAPAGGPVRGYGYELERSGSR